jgi:hypothetical protein
MFVASTTFKCISLNKKRKRFKSNTLSIKVRVKARMLEENLMELAGKL